jgi:hypothetical protein
VPRRWRDKYYRAGAQYSELRALIRNKLGLERHLSGTVARRLLVPIAPRRPCVLRNQDLCRGETSPNPTATVDDTDSRRFVPGNDMDCQSDIFSIL